MSQQATHAALLAFAHVQPLPAWGEVSYFVNPDGRLKRGAYFATIKQADGAHDRASALNRGGLWRLNFGLPKSDFQALFGPAAARSAKGGTIAGAWDFQALDRVTPHPVYGWMGWVCVLCPSAATWDQLRPLLALAHKKAVGAAWARLKKERLDA